MNAWRHHGRFLACCRSRCCTRGWRGDVRFVARDLCVIASGSFSCGARPDSEDDQLGIVRVAEGAEKSEWLTICQGRASCVRTCPRARAPGCECLCISILRVRDRKLPRGASNAVQASAVRSSESGGPVCQRWFESCTSQGTYAQCPRAQMDDPLCSRCYEVFWGFGLTTS
jgi:hypothetical protein